MSIKTLQKKLADCHFGRFIDEKGQIAKLGICYRTNGEMAERSLILPFSESAQPKIVMKRLLDAGADIDAKADLAELTNRLDNLDVKNGRFVLKVGHVGDVVIFPPTIYGEVDRQILVDNSIAEICSHEISVSGTHDKWEQEVAIPAEGSSTLMFVICLALSALVYKDLISDEGVIFNLAGTSGIGKTISAKVAKSVSGQSTKLFDWNASTRGLVEALAAGSDALFVIDDWEKIETKGSWSAHLRTTTHLITTGTSKDYANMVKEKLPLLQWTCPVLTSGPHTVEQQANKDSFSRTNGDRRRMIDIPIESNGGKGIWDRLDGDEDTSALSESIRSAAGHNFGHLFQEWVQLMIEDKARFVADIKKDFDSYVRDNRMHGDMGFEQTISKKFAIVFASGKKAIDDDLLPWRLKAFRDAVVQLHQLARNAITTDEQAVRMTFAAVNEATSNSSVFPSVKKSENAKFSSKAKVSGFIIEKQNSRHLYITLTLLEKIVGGKHNLALFQNKLREVKAHVAGSGGKTCIQMSVTVAGKPYKPRLMKIELDAFDHAMEILGCW